MTAQPNLPVVWVLIPTRGTMGYEFVTSTYEKLVINLQVYPTLFVEFGHSKYGIELVRKDLAKKAIDNGADYLFWIDDDILFRQPDNCITALAMLMEVDAPIAAGLYREKGEGFPYSVWRKGPDGALHAATEIKGSGIIDADAAGFGCILIKREVFMKIGYPYFKWDDTYGEDLSFCMKAARLGFKTKVRTDVKCDHVGTFKLTADGRMEPLQKGKA